MTERSAPIAAQKRSAGIYATAGKAWSCDGSHSHH